MLKLLAAAIVGCAVLIFGVLTYANWRDNSTDTAVTQHDADRAIYGEGHVGSHRFTYTTQRGRVVAIFTPLLPRDDDALIGATRAVVKTAFKAELSDEHPSLVGGEIRFAASDGVYFVTPIKQDTGQIHSLAIRSSRQ